MTDSETILEQYRARYGSCLVHEDLTCTRSDVGVHCQGLPGERLGLEVLIDTWLAARCDYFLGCGQSNVSTSVPHLKDWEPGTYRLLGNNFLLQRNSYLQDR